MDGAHHAQHMSSATLYDHKKKDPQNKWLAQIVLTWEAPSLNSYNHSIIMESRHSDPHSALTNS